MERHTMNFCSCSATISTSVARMRGIDSESLRSGFPHRRHTTSTVLEDWCLEAYSCTCFGFSFCHTR